jgi:glycosyltransferase involved in cell wall biosynthesis
MSTRVSVVIPTRDRERRLQAALLALGRQTLSADQFEVVVVRDRDQPGPFAEAPANLRISFHDFAGDPRAAGAKREVGWRRSRGNLIAFTDDDCVPAPQWLEELAAAHDGNSILQGRTEMDPAEAYLLRGFARTQTIVGPSPWSETCNIAYPRAVLDAVGGFDPDFLLDGEDTDLALRARKHGAGYRYVDSARVFHAVHSRSFVQALSDAGKWSSFPLVFVRHPEHRRFLYLGRFRNRSHAAISAGLLAACLPSRVRTRAGVWVAPYLLHKLAEEWAAGSRTPRGIARFAIYFLPRLLIELRGFATTARFALKYRSPMV